MSDDKRKPRYRKADDDSPADRCRIIPCPDCQGEGGYSVPVDINKDHGGVIERTVRCEKCDGEGVIEIELEDDDEC